MNRLLKGSERILLMMGIAWILIGAGFEFFDIAWGTGDWLGELSRTWGLLFSLYTTFAVVFYIAAGSVIWKREWISPLVDRILQVRQRLQILRWVSSFLILLLPVWFFQYTPWGLVFQKFHLRLLVWVIMILWLTVIFSAGKVFAGRRQFLSALVLTISVFSMAASLKLVNDHPFSLGWSEGNRLWDYSILFGRDRYDYPADRQIPVLLEFGRQLVGAPPFLIPEISIRLERLWVGLALIIPYILLGFAAFRMVSKEKKLWLIATLWTFLFLKQGPINPSLVWVAALVALAWRARMRYAIPLVLGATFYAALSRFTWLFAPGVWIVMLEFASASFADRDSAATAWKRSITLGSTGLLGALVFPKLIAMAFPQVVAVIPATAATGASANSASSPAFLDLILQQISDQPLLWYRLLPNATYGKGILLALFLAVAPTLVVLLFLVSKSLWRLTPMQKLSLVLPLLAFLVVGLVISTKIGGGGDLHNMDMFLIGLFFAGVIAWQKGGEDWLLNAEVLPPIMKVVIVLLVAITPMTPLMEMRPFTFVEDASWLQTLTDSPNEAALEMLPRQETVDLALQFIQQEVDQSKARGEVLFIDQRQLLTFGYITDVPFVPEYEKKALMNNALSSDSAYFNDLYSDLEARRFSLIISEPLRTPIKGSEYQFGEENNAWVKWVASPILCYYEPLETIKEVHVQLLVPKTEPVDCKQTLP